VRLNSEEFAMETKVVGIDLGTTNSVIAVPGHYPKKGVMFLTVTVIYDDVERLTQASAVCEVDGELIVGDDAKDKAAEGYTPVRFVKKYMGTGETFPVGAQEWTAEQVSAQVLRHMVGIAERALGIKVSQAVVTHPAYFDSAAIDATRKAAALAGLEVSGKLIMEPVAAAMAYTSEDPTERLRVLVYDLGGGTFDITLVDRENGVFQPVAFGGDRELGGYNFDKKIASKMLEDLQSKGYRLDIDDNRPERDARWASLMHHAEKLKFKLSEAKAVKADVSVPGIFKDDSKPPKSVNLRFSVLLKDFLTWIEPEIDKTMRQTREVVARANLEPKDINHLVLVGGSCRIPAIRARLHDELGLEPAYDEDVLDLSVAVGAALFAQTAGTTEMGVMLNHIPDAVDDTTLLISGRVLPEAGRPIGDLRVLATGGASGEAMALTTPAGRFAVEVELVPNQENEIELTIAGTGGEPIFRKTCRVRHDPSACPPPPPPTPTLAKRISVETVGGRLFTLAEEGVLLPFKKSTPFKTDSEMSQIPVRIFQEDVELCTLLLTDFKVPVPANGRVDLEVAIGDDYGMAVTAVVSSIDHRKSQQVVLPRPIVPSVDDLRLAFREQRDLYESQKENTPEGEHKLRICSECDRIVDEIDEILREAPPERLQASMLIKKLYVLSKQLARGVLSPTKAEMDKLFEEARQLLRKAIAERPELQDQRIDVTLDNLETEAGRAYPQSDATTWGRVATRVKEIIGMLMPKDPPPLPSAPVMKMYLLQLLGEVRRKLEEKGSRLSPADIEGCRRELDAAASKLEKVDLTGGNRASIEFIQIYQEHVAQVERMLDLPPAGGGLIPV
jgi:molecular chaperone DnaK (HSP70)